MLVQRGTLGIHWVLILALIVVCKGELHIKVSLQVLGSTTVYVEKLYYSFVALLKSAKLPQIMLLESASVGTEDYKFKDEKNLLVWSYAK